MDGCDDGPAGNTDPEPGGPEPEDGGDQKGLRDPVGPVWIVLPGEAVADGGIGEDGQDRHDRGEAGGLAGSQAVVAVRGPRADVSLPVCLLALACFLGRLQVLVRENPFVRVAIPVGPEPQAHH